jgi:hypothetical protein
VNTALKSFPTIFVYDPHGCGECRKCICPWLKIAPCIFHTSHIHVGRMDGSRAMHMYRTYGSRTTQERLSRSNCRYVHGWTVVGQCRSNCRYVHGWTVVGQCRSNCRGAIFCHSIPGDNRIAFLAPCGITPVHGHKK